MEKQRLLKEFVSSTGVEEHAALDILQDTSWNLNEAYKLFDNLVTMGKIVPAQGNPARGPSPRPNQQPLVRNIPIIVEQGYPGTSNYSSSQREEAKRNFYTGKKNPANMAQSLGPTGAKGCPPPPYSAASQKHMMPGHSGMLPPGYTSLPPGNLHPGSNRVNDGAKSWNSNSSCPVSEAPQMKPGTIRPESSWNSSDPKSYKTHPSTNLPTEKSLIKNTAVAPSAKLATIPAKPLDRDIADKTKEGKDVPGNGTVAASSSPRPLKRGISKIIENENLVDETRTSILQDIQEDEHEHMYRQTFILPDLAVFSADYRAFLEKDLIETSTLVSLEQAGRLNWWAELGICQRLMPLATTGDGNCLLHAASLAMWGIHDRQLLLRKELYHTLTKQSYSQALYRRWRWQQTQTNKESGLILNEDEWKEEWNGVLKLASTMPRTLPGTHRRNSSCCKSPVTKSKSSDDDDNTPVVYESLEEFHVFVLAHVLQRVIIVVADTILKDSCGEALAPIPFGGVYLPLECDAKHCYRSPLLLTYDAAHFSALVPMMKAKKSESFDCNLPVAIPLVGPDVKLLPVHFMVDPGANFNWTANKETETRVAQEDIVNKLQQYLDVEKFPMLNCDFEADADMERRSSGSYESDENSGSISKEKKKDGKMSQQLQSMSKQFGSLGKSMGKKLKKNFGSVGKALKSMGTDNDKGRKVSVGSGLTQSTKLPLTIVAAADQEQIFILCAKICTKQMPVTDKMVENYLQDARKRFEQSNQLRVAQGEEIRRRSSERLMEDNAPVECVNPECNMFGNPETNYLCSKCFTKQRQEALNQEHNSKPSIYPNLSAAAAAKNQLASTVQKCGKSTFYVGNDDDEVFAKPVAPPLRNPAKVEKGTGQNPRPASVSASVKAPLSAKSGAVAEKAISISPEVGRKIPQQPPLTAQQQSDLNSIARPRPVSHIPHSGSNPKIELNTKNNLGNAKGPVKMERTPSPDYDNVDYNRSRKSCPPNVFPKVQNKDANTISRECRTPGCVFFGVEATDFYCSSCYKKKKGIQKTQL